MAENFQNFCAKTMSVNGYSIHLRNIRAVYNYLITEERITKYPFRGFRIKSEPTAHRVLEVEQLRRIRDLECPKFMAYHRDIFMLMFYLIGINAKDLMYLREEDLRNGRIHYRRFKTGRPFDIKVEPEAMEIIERYRGKKHLLNCLDRCKDHLNFLHRLNDTLKRLGMEYVEGKGYVGEPICPELSSYWSRHTWATMAFDIDIPKDIVSLALGHSLGAGVTDIYIRYGTKKVDAANRKVIDYLNKNSPTFTGGGET